MFNDYEKEIKTVYHLVEAVWYHDKPEYDYTITLDSVTDKEKSLSNAYRILKNVICATRGNDKVCYVATNLDGIMDHSIVVYEDDKVTIRFYIETELTSDPYDLY